MAYDIERDRDERKGSKKELKRVGVSFCVFFSRNVFEIGTKGSRKEVKRVGFCFVFFLVKLFFFFFLILWIRIKLEFLFFYLNNVDL